MDYDAIIQRVSRSGSLVARFLGEKEEERSDLGIQRLRLNDVFRGPLE